MEKQPPFVQPGPELIHDAVKEYGFMESQIQKWTTEYNHRVKASNKFYKKVMEERDKGPHPTFQNPEIPESNELRMARIQYEGCIRYSQETYNQIRNVRSNFIAKLEYLAGGRLSHTRAGIFIAIAHVYHHAGCTKEAVRDAAASIYFLGGFGEMSRKNGSLSIAIAWGSIKVTGTKHKYALYPTFTLKEI